MDDCRPATSGYTRTNGFALSCAIYSKFLEKIIAVLHFVPEILWTGYGRPDQCRSNYISFDALGSRMRTTKKGKWREGWSEVVLMANIMNKYVNELEATAMKNDKVADATINAYIWR